MSRKAHIAIVAGGLALTALGLRLWHAEGFEILLDAVMAFCA